MPALSRERQLNNIAKHPNAAAPLAGCSALLGEPGYLCCRFLTDYHGRAALGTNIGTRRL